MRSMAALASVLGAFQLASAKHIGWQFTFDRTGFGQEKYNPAIANGMAHYVLEHGYLSNVQQEFGPLAIADFPYFGIRARDVRGGIYVKFRIDGQWQKSWAVANWLPRDFQTRYVDLREYGEKVSGLWLNSQSSVDGAEWFLDWVGLVKSDNPLNVNILSAGALTRLPDSRSLVFTLTNGLDAEAELVCAVEGLPPNLERNAGKPFRLSPGQTTQVSLATASEAGSRYELSVVDRNTEAVYYRAALVVPPVLEARVQSPSYRNAIYATQHLETVELRCGINVFPPASWELELNAMLLQGEKLLRQTASSIRDSEAHLAIPVEGVDVGEYAVVIDLKHKNRRLARSRVPLHVRAPHPNEVRIDRNLNTVSNGKPFLPVGFYSVPTQYLQRVAEAGFSVVLTYSRGTEHLREYLDEAARVRLKAVVHSPALWFGENGEEKLRDAVATLRDHPALLGWYLIDEPSLERKGTAPADLARLYALMQELDPYHPTFTVYCRPEEFAAYRDTHDVFMCDPYPVGHQPLPYVAKWTELAKAAMAGEKPVHIVPQSFGSEKGPQVWWRLPTAAEEICMGYLALVHGAKALFYYRFDVQQYDKSLADQGKWPWPTIGYLPALWPETWAGFEKLGPQLKRLAPVILSPEPEAKITVTPEKPALHVALREHQGTRYLFAVNPHEDIIDARITVEGMTAETVQRLPEGSAGPAAESVTERYIAVKAGAFLDRFGKLAVHIYRLE